MDVIKGSGILGLEVLAGVVAAFMIHDVAGPDFFNLSYAYAGVVLMVMFAASAAQGPRSWMVSRLRPPGNA